MGNERTSAPKPRGRDAQQPARQPQVHGLQGATNPLREFLLPGAPPAARAGHRALGVQRFPSREAPGPEAPSARWIVEDDAEAQAPGQLRKTEFLARAREALIQALATPLAGTPWAPLGRLWVEQGIQHHAARSAPELERALLQNVPDAGDVRSAEDYVPLLAARVRAVAGVLVASGSLPAVEPVSPTPPADGDDRAVQAKGAPDATALDAGAVAAQLGAGSALGGSQRARMGDALGADLSSVRVHTDAGASELARRFGARAFTVGSHVAFAAGEYRPGTPIGDALLAHELVHVVQQRGATPGAQAKGAAPREAAGALEEEADLLALDAMLSLWGDADHGPRRGDRAALGALRASVGLQRCDDVRPLVDRTAEARLSLRAIRALFRRKERIARGDEPTAALDEVNQGIARAMGHLRELGLELTERELYQRITTGTDPLRLNARLQGPAQVIRGERAHYAVAFDYVQAGETATVLWGWRARAGGTLVRLPGHHDRATARSVTLDEVAWDAGLARASSFQMVAQVYLGEHLVGEATPANPWTSVVEELPQALVLEAIPAAGMVGAWVTFRVAGWAPSRRSPDSGYALDWRVDDRPVSRGAAVLRYRFRTPGEHRVAATIQTARRGQLLRDRVTLGTPEITVRVAAPQQAADAALDQLTATAPSLPDFSNRLRESIGEARLRAAHGGAQQPYWERRLRAEEERLANLERLAPGVAPTDAPSRPLPADPLALEAGAPYSGPLPTVLVLDENGAMQPLNVYVTVAPEHGAWRAAVIDVTGREVYRFQGTGARPADAYRNAFQEWASMHPYPRGGQVFYRFPGSAGSFRTSNGRNGVTAFVDNVLAIGGIVVVGLLMLAPTGVTQSLAFVIAAGALSILGAARSGVAIYDNVQRGGELGSTANAIECVSIVSSFFGLGGGQLRAMGLRTSRPMMFRAGAWMVLATVAGDAAVLAYVSEEAAARLREAQADPTLDESQRSAQFYDAMGRLLLQGALTFASNKDLFVGPNRLRRSDFFSTDPHATAARIPDGPLHLEPGERVDLAAELRRAGDDPARLRPPERNPQGDVTGMSNEELVARFLSLPWARGAGLSEAETRLLLRDLGTEAMVVAQGEAGFTARDALNVVRDVGGAARANALLVAFGGGRLRALLAGLDGARVAALYEAFGVAGLRTLAAALPHEGTALLMRLFGAPGLAELWGRVGPRGVRVILALARAPGVTDAVVASFARHPPEVLARFEAVPAGALRRYALLADDALERFAGVSEGALARFGALTDPAFDRFAARTRPEIEAFADVPTPALERYGALSDATLGEFAAMGKAAVERFATLVDPGAPTSPRFDRYVALPAPVRARFANADPRGLAEMADLGVDEFTAFAALSEPQVAAYGERSRTELETFYRATRLPTTAAALGEFGDLGVAGVRKLALLDEEGLDRFARAPAATRSALVGASGVAMWPLSRVPHNGLAKLAALTPGELANLTRSFGVEGMRAVALLERPAMERFARLPHEDLVKFDGMNAWHMAELAGRPPGALEGLAALHDGPALRRLVGDDPLGRIAAEANARALDYHHPVSGVELGHSYRKHGPQTMLVDTTLTIPGATTPLRMNRQEIRLRYGIDPGDSLPKKKKPRRVASVFASFAAQMAAERKVSAALTRILASGTANPKYGFDTTDQPRLGLGGAGYSYHLEGYTEVPNPFDTSAIARVGGRVVETQVDLVEGYAARKPTVTTPTTASDYYLITLYPTP